MKTTLPIRRAGRAPTAAACRLFCLPPAGAGASLFYPWLDAAPPDVEVCPVALPGREDRLAEPLPASIDALADDLSAALAPALDRPYAIVGYSMGALIGWALLQRWRAQGRRAPAMFFALAARAPSVVLPRDPPLHTLPAAQFRRTLVDIGGTPRELLEHADAMALFEPILRNDLRIAEQYRPAPQDRPMDCALHALFGKRDVLMGRADVEPWAACTRGAFSMQELDAPHMLPRPALAALLGPMLQRWKR